MSSPAALELPHAAAERERDLIEWLRGHDSLLLGFSGGVDSAYLACVAIEAVGAERFLAVIGRSASYPAEQWQTAREVAARAGIEVLEVDTHEMDDPRYVANPTNRCYFCKSELWSVLERVRIERGFATIIDGTNADDLSDHRPGKKAASEQGIRSPLAELGFIVVAIDGMGTPWRSKSFHDAYYGKMGDNTLPDQVAGMKELSSRYSFINMDKMVGGQFEQGLAAMKAAAEGAAKP